MKRRSVLAGAAAVSVPFSAPFRAGAQAAYPDHPIRIVVPVAAGGGNDIVARTVNIKLPSLLGQNLIIDNRAGAGGNLGAELAAKAPADG